MQDGSGHEGRHGAGAEDMTDKNERAARLAAELRANLRRRKAQAKEKAQRETTDGTEPTPDPSVTSSD